jgi:uncharacterized protein YabE (DUF348 family)
MMLMNSKPQVCTCLLLVVAQCHGGLANITLTRLTIEAELTALDTTNTEVEWMHELLIDLSVVKKTNTNYP